MPSKPGFRLVAPGVVVALTAAPRGVLPLRFGGEAGPARAKRVASFQETWTTGWSPRPPMSECGPYG